MAANPTRSPDDWQVDLPLTALRDPCTCAECRHPSGQRLLDPAKIPLDLGLGEVIVQGDTVCVLWLPEGHRSVYSRGDLLRHAAANSAPTLWDGSASAMLPVAEHSAIGGSRRELLRWLTHVDAMGCGLLHGVPTVDGEVARVAGLFAHVRETNYGRWFDVRSVVDPTNLANSSLGLAAHTDNPYRGPVPTMQLLHCLESTASGGENFLVDGWRIAEEVRNEQPAGFDCLCQRGVEFRYRDQAADLMTTAPIIEVDGLGTIRVRFNPRSMQQPSMPADELGLWYDAYLLFARLVAEPLFQIRFQLLHPGDLFVVDNRRVLDGRTAFESTSGTRHLQGCYADIDGLRSTIAVLSRDGDLCRARSSTRSPSCSQTGAGRPTSANRCRSPSTCCKRPMPQCATKRLRTSSLQHCCTTSGTSSTRWRQIPPTTASTPSTRRSARSGCRVLLDNVTAPIRLHVAAKRYRCAATAGYSTLLSPASVHSLMLQGGPMTLEEIAAFRSLDPWSDAVLVRRWDDEGKVAGRGPSLRSSATGHFSNDSPADDSSCGTRRPHGDQFGAPLGVLRS